MAATAASSSVPLLCPYPRGLKSQGNQVTARTVQGNVNCRAKEMARPRARPNGLNSSSAAIGRRRGRHGHSPSRLVLSVSQLKATARTGAEACEDSTEGDDGEDDATIQQALIHRRQLLCGATGTFSYLTSAGFGIAAPVPPPNLSTKYCEAIPDEQSCENCCLPDLLKAPIDFKFEDLPMRIRKPAHILSKDEEYVKKYNQAYVLMKGLDPDDPRSFKAQWHIHCAFCMGAYFEPNNPNDIKLQYHYSWAFAPWHRMYLYFHERILGDLIGDKSFALPVWNWDNQQEGDGGNQMPWMFAPLNFGATPSELSNAIRNPEHFPPQVVRLDPCCYYEDMGIVYDSNLAFMHRAVVSSVSSTNFLGKPYRAGQTEDTNGPGSIEENGHNIIHSWTGSNYLKIHPNNSDMGTFLFTAKDPIFYSHHANVDRLWTVWKSLKIDPSTRRGSRKREDPTDSDFLDTQFAFYNHKKELVNVKISQTLHTDRLCYKYEALDSDQDWINYKFKPSGYEKPSPGEIDKLGPDTVLKKGVSVSVPLSRIEPTPSPGDELEETLVILGVQVPRHSVLHFKVYINLLEAGVCTPLGVENFVGVIAHIPHSGSHGKRHKRKVDFRISIGACVKALGIERNERVSVTFVPGTLSEDVDFDGVAVEWN
ncbi:polyphenol oxidase [Marchantia polymorpha subsp. ruderalis]|uniref:Tyrosinase copper-binding domain-containing protein n=2 Tax=Marchantia polymorpha TaxID=3197 RepID=A0AAF6B471_MARPO|nr:hypothetical protein MARPO_0121s0018 [Marchantia polymorpha]PTQ30670.1 hypothetical protein MARPO_0121s0018 [Marchantia polymorpha]BBN06805.1 hypothetical protein Mp_3g24060 [Marchantia polymorpha subsp. ruderalis]BBN06806.1 hypothetical protein Mp_3g24060 [Marchantia polymorpha subsp. ruderalis]|eukprot:PTQ30669.1 hypothetical protein MARPO_0121s0018 [Marchantia polymorpha]